MLEIELKIFRIQIIMPEDRITESQNHRITESQNGRVRKGPLGVI